MDRQNRREGHFSNKDNGNRRNGENRKTNFDQKKSFSSNDRKDRRFSSRTTTRTEGQPKDASANRFDGRRFDAPKKNFSDRGVSSQKRGERTNFSHRPDSRQKPLLHPKGGITPARALALEALMDVSASEAYSTLALDRRLKEMHVTDVDRRLATELFYGVLEKQLQLDYILKQWVKHEIGDFVVQNILRLGTYQILFMDRIPSSAAVSQAVEQTRHANREALCALVNATLRNIIRGKNEITYPEDPKERLSILYSMPLWLIDTFLSYYSFDEVQAILAADSKGHPLCVRYHAWLSSQETFEAFLRENEISFEKSNLKRSYRVRGASMMRYPEYREGLYSIQSEGSMLSALAVGAKRGMQILDVCAAPGGKTCLMAEEMQNTGRVYAWDVHPHRVELLHASASRLRLDNVRPREHDATKLVPDLIETMDAVLVDAPCSGTGEALNKPDIKYRLTQDSLNELCQLQKDILAQASCYVKKGGTLVYSTCSFLPCENEQIVNDFLSSHPQFTLCKLENNIPQEFASRIKNSMLQLMPQTDGEGFFIARMEKK